MGLHIKTLSGNDRFFVIDVGSTHIKVLLCDLEEGQLNILERVSVRQSRKHMFGGDISDLQGVSEALQKTLGKIEKNRKQEVPDCIFSIQSPSLVTDTFSMNYVREKESRILDMEEIDSMVAKIEQKSLEKAKPKILSQIMEDESQMKLFTTSLTSITIDGKKVANPIGFTGKNISLTVCNVFIPMTTFHLYSTIARNIDKKILSFVPTPIALTKAQADSLEIFDPNGFVDIGYSLTSITLENYSELLGSVQIPIGSSQYENMFVRKFPKLSRLEIEHMMQGDPENLSKEAKKIQKDFVELLIRAIVVALRMISSQFLLKNVYVSGGIAQE
jgi:cell division ATPase FtsA